MADATVGFGSKTTLSHDFSKHLAAAGRTISTATVTASAGAVSNVTTSGGTAVLFRFDATTITGPDPVNVTVTTTPTYDNGDIDPRVKTIQVTAAT